MTEEQTARALLEIGRPVDVVRAHFFDLDHAIANQIYHGVTLSAAPPSGDPGEGTPPDSGERRVRREMRVLDRVLVDDVVVTRGADGSWVLSFVEGQNAGGRFVARFDPADSPEATRVELQAFAPKGGFSFGLGRLSALGLEKALQKMLQEHQRAVEGYEPGARITAVGTVLAALDDLTAAAKRGTPREQKSLVALLLEVAGAVAIADGVADDAERAVLDEVARALCGTSLDEAARARLVQSAASTIAKDGMERQYERLGKRLKVLGCAGLGLAIAAVVAEVSHGIDAPELAALQKIAAGAGVREATLASIVSRVDEEMFDAAPARSARAPAPAKKPPPLPPAARGKKANEK